MSCSSVLDGYGPLHMACFKAAYNMEVCPNAEHHTSCFVNGWLAVNEVDVVYPVSLRILVTRVQWVQ